MVKLLAVYFLWALIAQGSSGTLEETGSGSASQKKLSAMHIEAHDTENALWSIAQKANVTIGVEGVRSEPRTETKFVLDFSGGTVSDLLNAFTSQHQEWEWKEENGAIHVSRKGTRVSLVDVMITKPTE